MSTTIEYYVQGRLIIEGKSRRDCDEEAERQLGEIFYDWKKEESR